MTKPPKRVPLAEGQTAAFSEPALQGQQPTEGVTYVCRECKSTRIIGPVIRTVDPRWVIASCMDCADRQVCTVYTHPKREEPDASPGV